VRQINAYAQAHEKYYLKHHQEGMYMLDPFPKVILIPGIGMVTSGKDLKSARIVAEIYEHSIDVMKAASSVDQYASLSEELAFEMEYWPMELYKLTLAPPEKELSRQVGLVTGAAGGIGKSVAAKLAHQGAHVVITDINEKKIKLIANQINEEMNAQRVFGWVLDVTKEKAVEDCFKKIVRAFGGLDFVVSNAGIAHVSSVENLRLEDWNRSMAVNATGHFLIAKGATRLLREQQLGGSLVFVASKNVLAPGKDFGAYSAAKAAETQLARICAIENGEAGIRVNLVNPDGVFEDSGLWDGIRKSRAKSYGIQPQELEKYYQNRNQKRKPFLFVFLVKLSLLTTTQHAKIALGPT
jgi:NAD(P)-dependent dehydrogenase (short-subunit alcohol dehydrogenase family)